MIAKQTEAITIAVTPASRGKRSAGRSFTRQFSADDCKEFAILIDPRLFLCQGRSVNATAQTLITTPRRG